MPDDAGKPEFRFALRTALWWSLVPLVALYVYIKLERLFAPGTYLCLHWDNARQCAYSMVSVDSYWALILTVFGSLCILWLVCRLRGEQTRDPHPLLVTLGFLVGGFVSLFALEFVDGINAGGTALLAGAGAVVSAALASCIRAPRRSVLRAVVTIVVPLVPLAYFAFSVQTPGEVRQNIADYMTYKLDSAASNAVEQAKHYPKRLESAYAGAWLETTELDASDKQREIIEEHIGQVDATGPGLDLHKAVGHLMEQHGDSTEDPMNAAASFGREGVWTNLYLFGRETTGYCLTQVTGVLASSEPFSIMGRVAVPNVWTHSELSYCVLDETLLAFDEKSDEPRLVEDVECLPRFAASPYASDPTERAANSYLRAITGESREAADRWLDDCQTFASRAASDDFDLQDLGLSEAAKDILFDSEGDWMLEVNRRLGHTGLAVVHHDADTGERARNVQKYLERMQYAPSLPDRGSIEAVFGEVRDLSYTRDSALALENRLGERARTRSDEELLDVFSGGVDFVRYIVGVRRAGWCRFDAHATSELEPSSQTYQVEPDFQLSFCLAGDELVAFGSDGEVERRWEAGGLSRTAPLAGPAFDDVKANPGSEEALDAYKAERERVALLEQFYEQLTSGRLDDVAQLEMLAMAEGAKTLDKASLRAMQRMVAQNAEAAARP